MVRLLGREEKVAKYCAITVLLSGFFLSLGASLVTPTPLGSDVYYHLEIAYEWARGENAFLSPFVLSHAHTPYPPLFHWLLVPSVWLDAEFTFARILQVVFMTGTLGLTMWFVKKYAGIKASLFSGLFLMSSVPFTDSITQVRPQSLTMLLLIPILYFYIEKKKLGFVVTFLVTVYSWSVSPVLFLYGLILARLKDKKWWKVTLSIIVLVSILGALIYHFSDLSAMLGRWGGHMDSLQERLIWEQPLQTLPIYLGTAWVGMLALARFLSKWKENPEYIKTICLVLLSSAILIPLWTDRWLQMASILFAVLSGVWLSQQKNSLYQGVLMYVVIMFLYWQTYYWLATFSGAWYSAGGNQWWGAP